MRPPEGGMRIRNLIYVRRSPFASAPRVERKKVKARIRQGIKKPKTAAAAAYRHTFGLPAILKILAKK